MSILSFVLLELFVEVLRTSRGSCGLTRDEVGGRGRSGGPYSGGGKTGGGNGGEQGGIGGLGGVTSASENVVSFRSSLAARSRGEKAH